jgi:hypothetical protein
VDANVERSMVIPAGIRGSVHVGALEAPATITVDKPGDPLIVLNNQPAGTVVEAEDLPLRLRYSSRPWI